jgi:multicomponent Na+:H+ antiporter subunit B
MTKDSKRRLIILSIVSIISVFTFLIFYFNDYSGSNPTLMNMYLSLGEAETGATNIVAAIYLNYRLFDTLIESFTLAIGALAVTYFFWESNNDKRF